MVINLEQKKIHFDLRFILTYNIYIYIDIYIYIYIDIHTLQICQLHNLSLIAGSKANCKLCFEVHIIRIKEVSKL